MIYEDALDAKKATTPDTDKITDTIQDAAVCAILAISSGCAVRFNGVSLLYVFNASGIIHHLRTNGLQMARMETMLTRAAISVSTSPGATQFTRMLSAPHSQHNVRVNTPNADLDKL